MAANKEDIRRWLKSADEKTTHMLVVCDTYDWEDYPVYLREGEDINIAINNHSGNMQRIMEVYNMSMDIEAQLNEGRARNL